MVLGHVPEVGDVWSVVLDYGDGELLDLAGSDACPALRLERFMRCPDPVADAQVLHSTISLRGANSRTSFRKSTLIA